MQGAASLTIFRTIFRANESVEAGAEFAAESGVAVAKGRAYIDGANGINGAESAPESIQCRGTAKHVFHVRHMGDVPARNLLIECRGTAKHPTHVCHLGDVPATNILIECRGTAKHPTHVRHLGDVPATNGCIEVSLEWKEERKVRQGWSKAPILNETVIISTRINVGEPNTIIKKRETTYGSVKRISVWKADNSANDSGCCRKETQRAEHQREERLHVDAV